MSRGLFITFEGPDGAGKSTQIKMLSRFLCERGEAPILTREPGGTALGEKIREILLSPQSGSMTDITEMLLYAAARAQIVEEVIRPQVEAGHIVICDRFVDSSIAYQGYGRGLGRVVSEVNAHAVRDCLPDLTILLDIPPARCFLRKEGEKGDRIEAEALAWHSKVYEGYLTLAGKNRSRIRRVDADRGVHQVQDEIRDIVTACIDARRVKEGTQV
ncbi:MAG: dTMP kinase [Clostridiales Family XIII bacterium]|jgi:dTMP kinase|nr:dTMP kinase [Clostridiales Family XIII bacterium]